MLTCYSYINYVKYIILYFNTILSIYIMKINLCFLYKIQQNNNICGDRHRKVCLYNIHNIAVFYIFVTRELYLI